MKKVNFSFQKQTSEEPVYKQVADYLHDLILSGTLEKGMQLPSEVDLAEMLKVSRLTLRKSFSILISRELIIQIPHCGTFVAEQKKKHLRIGLLYSMRDSDKKNTYGSQILLAFCQMMNRYAGTEIVFLDCFGYSDEEIAEKIARSNCDGYIVAFGASFFAKILDQPKYDMLPVVYINKHDDFTGGLRFNVSLEHDPFKEVMEHLMVCGHKKIAYISVSSPIGHIPERNQSFLRHCPEDAVCVLKEPDDSWFEYAKKETIKLCRSSERPSVIVTSGTLFTAGVLHGLMESKLTVPEDISLVGFDYAGELYPNLSTVEQPLYDMADKAVSLIFDTIRGKVYRNHTILFDSVFKDRGSIKKLNRFTKQRKGKICYEKNDRKLVFC